MPPEELRNLLASNETDRVEKNRSTQDVDTFREAICAFSNDIGGKNLPSYLLIGVDEKDPAFRLRAPDGPGSPESDPNCLGSLKHCRSLMPMAMEARKPIFHLKPVDGAIGAHTYAVRDCGEDFRKLAKRIADTLQAVEGG